MTYIGEEFQKRYKTLPEDIQNALTAIASVDTLTAIGKKHGLMIDQIGKMADEIWKVMLGLANPKDFIRNLASALGIDSAKASAIASEVNAQMFQTVRESLRKIYDESRSTNQESREISSSLRSHEAGEAIPQSKDGIATSSDGHRSPRDDNVPPMIYPQDRFEESFKEEPVKEDVARSTYHVVREKEEQKEPLEQLAPPPPMIPPQPSSTPPSLAVTLPNSPDDFTYPEKTKEVSREPAASKGGYKSRDPYRESIEE